jgi:PAS domain S-box-containing protein
VQTVPAASTPTLLLVEDDADVRDTMKRLVEARGFCVRGVADGLEALEYLSSAALPDLVLLDRTLPGMDGLEVLRVIRRRHSPGELPVIIVTGTDESDAVVEALELGANDYLAKPIDVPVAIARIRTQLARRCAERALLESEERYALVIRAANDGIFDWRIDRGEGHFSPRWRALLGCEDASQATLDTWYARVHPDDIAPLHANIAEHLDGRTEHFEFEHRVQGPNESYRWVLARGVAVRNAAGKPIRLTGSISDITEGKVADALTGLPNRVLLMDRLGRLLGYTRRNPGFQVVVMFIDLDRFKMINDSLGHQAGDALLIQAAARLDGCVRSTDTVARFNAVRGSSIPGSTVGRMGGDEFVVVLGGVNQAQGAQLVADRLHAAFNEPFDVSGQEVFVSLSIGVASSGPHTEHAEELLHEADTAMYRAKALGPARTEFFTVDMRSDARVQLQADTDLRRAFERREFDVWYQPIVALETGRTATLEALLRWREGNRTLVGTGELVSMAERMGLIVPIGYWVLERACAEMAKWSAASSEMRHVGVSVNLSAKQLAVPELVTALEAIVDRAGVAHQRVEFELTESCVMADPEAARATLEALRARGFRLSIDDFGTGHSSLSYVHRLPVHRLKVDRSFLSRERGTRETEVVMRAILEVGRQLGLGVVAEGVETEADMDRLRALGCELAQGYYFASPQPATRVAQAVRAARARTLVASAHG